MKRILPDDSRTTKGNPVPPTDDRPGRKLRTVRGDRKIIIGAVAALLIAGLMSVAIRGCSADDTNFQPGDDQSLTGSTPAVPEPTPTEDDTESEETPEPEPKSAAPVTPRVDEVPMLLSIRDPKKFVEGYTVLFTSYGSSGKGGVGGWLDNIKYASTDAMNAEASLRAARVWQGAGVGGLSVNPVGAPNAQKLWGDENAAMWRSFTSLHLESVDGVAAMAGNVTVVWDFYIVRQDDGSFRVAGFGEPGPVTENPDYVPPGG